MRIELPPASWADTAHRADDDAHTLTLAPLASDRLPGVPPIAADPTESVRTEIGGRDPVTFTVTF